MKFAEDATFLVVVAHPDDEALGFGGSAYVLSERGHRIHSAILVGDADARHGRPELQVLHNDTDEAHLLLGMEPPIRGAFPNIKLNTVPHLDLVQFIEDAIVTAQPDVLVTVHPGDLNDDHYQVSRACQAAARLPQRRPDVKPIGALLFMEVLSSTDWAVRSASARFSPQMYIGIGREALDTKIAALHQYRGVMRKYPHSRSSETISALATMRGSEMGLDLAEAFEVGFLRSSADNV